MAKNIDKMNLVHRVLVNSPELTSEDLKNIPNYFNQFEINGNETDELLDIYGKLTKEKKEILMDFAKKCLASEKNNYPV